MASEEVLRKLSRLTQRERDVLWLRCEGLDQRAISQRLYISVPTVRNTMGRILAKLEIDQIPQAQRTKELFETYCPALRGEELSPPPPEPPQPEPVPDEVIERVEEDEKALVLWQGAQLDPPAQHVITIPRHDPPGDRGRGRSFSWLISGLIIGIALMLVGFWVRDLLRQGEIETREPLPTSVPTVLVTEIVVVSPTAAPTVPTLTPLVEKVVVTQMVTATPDPDASTTIVPVLERVITEEVTVVVTATSPPTPTEPVNTPNDAVLEVREWWKTNGVWLRVSEVGFADDARISILLEMWNQTDNQLIFEWTMAGNFTLTDNTGHVYDINYGGGLQGGDESYEAGQNKAFSLGAYTYTVSYSDRFLFNPSVTDLYLTVTDLSRVEYARFHFTTPK